MLYKKNNDKIASTQIRKLYIKIWEKGHTHMYMYIYITYVIYVFCYRKHLDTDSKDFKQQILS